MINPENVHHVFPTNDIQEHILFLEWPVIGEPFSKCKCNPRIDNAENDGLIVVHFAFDDRQNFEPDNKVRLN